MNNTDSNPIDLAKLKELIRCGIQAIPIDENSKEAVLVIGDTGVGKSTIMSFLCGSKLMVKFDGLKPILDNSDNDDIKIGHQKFSETTIPTKVAIDGMAFYDCPGFKDNKGEEYEISNSFFVQRLLDIYQRVKLVLIVDQSHISQARADKLPKLIRNLHRSFRTFEDIKDGVTIIINRAEPEHTIGDYHKQLTLMLNLRNEKGALFEPQQKEFMNFLMSKGNLVLFKQAKRQESGGVFKARGQQNRIMQLIRQSNYVKSKHIQNILSQSAKLSIRDYIDEITLRSNVKIAQICKYIINKYSEKSIKIGNHLDNILQLKEDVIRLAEEIKSVDKQEVLIILQRQLPRDKIVDFEEEYASIMFFKGIYDKTNTYFLSLVNKIYSELSRLLVDLDKKIFIIEKEERLRIQRDKEIERNRIKEMKMEQQKNIINMHGGTHNQLMAKIPIMRGNNQSLIQKIKECMHQLNKAQYDLNQLKNQSRSLKVAGNQITNEFKSFF